MSISSNHTKVAPGSSSRQSNAATYTHKKSMLMRSKSLPFSPRLIFTFQAWTGVFFAVFTLAHLSNHLVLLLPTANLQSRYWACEKVQSESLTDANM
mmetsp:Transcript_1610/g.5532  ORF Transcript_1610/g.5532 Transcript_1610/m.5532 type:complete len:97 (+) Transcript_1610:4253-4543(+)